MEFIIFLLGIFIAICKILAIIGIILTIGGFVICAYFEEKERNEIHFY